MKKIVVSTNYDDMIGLNSTLGQTSFNLFMPYARPTDGDDDLLIEPIVCWCGSKGCFQLYSGQETDLIFIPDDLSSEELLGDLVINNEDYFLAHVSTLKESQADFAARFNQNHIAKGHHDPTLGGSYSYHRTVANIMTDGNIAPDQKAEEIIRQIWPEKEMQRATSDRLLESYYSRQEVLTSDDPCPSVFADGGAMEAAFDELKKHKPCTPEFEAAYKKLQDLSYNKYYK